MVSVKVAKNHLVSTVLQKSVEVRGVVPRAGGCTGDVYIDKGQCGSSEEGLNCQNFCSVIIGENATVRHPIGDGVVYEGDKSPTATPGRAIAPNSGIVCELLERGVHSEFGLLHAGDQHLVTMQEVLQLSVAVEDAVAVELQEPASL